MHYSGLPFNCAANLLDTICILEWLLESLIDRALSLFNISSEIALGCASLASSIMYLNINFIDSALNLSSAGRMFAIL